MPPARFEPAIPAIERLQSYALDRTATGMDKGLNFLRLNWRVLMFTDVTLEVHNINF